MFSAVSLRLPALRPMLTPIRGGLFAQKWCQTADQASGAVIRHPRSFRLTVFPWPSFSAVSTASKPSLPRNDLVIEPGKAAFVLGDQDRREAAVAVARDVYPQRSVAVSTVLRLLPLRWLVAYSGRSPPGGYPRWRPSSAPSACSIPNTAASEQTLLDWRVKHSAPPEQSHAVLESTGQYHEQAATALYSWTSTR